MNISAIGGGHTHPFGPIQAATRPETAEVAGVADHDGDSDDRGANAVSGGTSKSSLVDRLA